MNLNNRIKAASIAAWAFVVAGFVFALCFSFRFNWSSPTDLASMGSFFQGTVVALWSLAAFIFVYVAFLGQRLQMEQQQTELGETRAQVKKQADLEAQRQFESTFFELLRLHHNLVDALQNQDYNQRILHGRACFRIIYNRLNQSWASHVGEAREDLEKIEITYQEFYTSPPVRDRALFS